MSVSAHADEEGRSGCAWPELEPTLHRVLPPDPARDTRAGQAQGTSRPDLATPAA